MVMLANVERLGLEACAAALDPERYGYLTAR
jgi:hypothetical protein